MKIDYYQKYLKYKYKYLELKGGHKKRKNIKLERPKLENTPEETEQDIIKELNNIEILKYFINIHFNNLRKIILS